MKTDRLSIEKVTEEDFKNLVKLHTCSSVREYLGGALDYKSACERAKALINKSSGRFWVLKDKNRNFVGTIELSKHHDSSETEVSYLLISHAWGLGFAQEALEKIIEYSHNDLKITKILAETQTKNLRSINLLKKSGFKKIRELERFGEQQSLFRFNA